MRTNPGRIYPPHYGRFEMLALLNGETRAAGTVKFDASVTVEKLLSLVTQMKSNNPERWVDLYIRGAGDDGAHYIAFHYILPDGKKSTHTRAVKRLLKFLRTELGTRPRKGGKPNPVPRGVKGWSISTVKVLA